MSFYSLVKPPKGSNVQGVDLFKSLLNFEVATDSGSNRDEWDEVLDIIVTKGPSSLAVVRPGDEHDYNVAQINDKVQAYFSGFVARKMRTWTNCAHCLATLTKDAGDEPHNALIRELTMGYLLYPSDALFQLLSACEHAVQKTVGTTQINAYTFLQIADNVLAESAPFVGCAEHQDDLTKKVINYYMISRARILGKQYNEIHDQKRQDEQKNRKKSKL